MSIENVNLIEMINLIEMSMSNQCHLDRNVNIIKNVNLIENVKSIKMHVTFFISIYKNIFRNKYIDIQYGKKMFSLSKMSMSIQNVNVYQKCQSWSKIQCLSKCNLDRKCQYYQKCQCWHFYFYIYIIKIFSKINIRYTYGKKCSCL